MGLGGFLGNPLNDSYEDEDDIGIYESDDEIEIRGTGGHPYFFYTDQLGTNMMDVEIDNVSLPSADDDDDGGEEEEDPLSSDDSSLTNDDDNDYVNDEDDNVNSLSEIDVDVETEEETINDN